MDYLKLFRNKITTVFLLEVQVVIQDILGKY